MRSTVEMAIIGGRVFGTSAAAHLATFTPDGHPYPLIYSTALDV
jgi:hypothetical protein